MSDKIRWKLADIRSQPGVAGEELPETELLRHVIDQILLCSGNVSGSRYLKWCRNGFIESFDGDITKASRRGSSIFAGNRSAHEGRAHLAIWKIATRLNRARNHLVRQVALH